MPKLKSHITLIALFLFPLSITAQSITSFSNFHADSIFNTYVSDFVVNDDDSGNVDHAFPDVTCQSDSIFIITWCDIRNTNFDIFCQRYKLDGSAIGDNFKINDDTGNLPQQDPCVAAAANGNFAIAWEDYRHGHFDIYCQRFDATDNVLGENFKVNGISENDNKTHSDPVIAMDQNGNFVVAWVEFSNYDTDIYAQRYDSTGNALGDNFRVNNDKSTRNQSSPSIAMDKDGKFVITWTDYRNGTPDIYCQRYDTHGDIIGTNVKINQDTGDNYQINPTIAYDGSGNFIIAWGDDRSGNGDIYFQRYDASGFALGENLNIMDDMDSLCQYEPYISMDDSGYFAITWTERYNGMDVYCQRFNPEGHAIGANFMVNSIAAENNQTSPSMAIDGNRNFMVVWQDMRNGGIYDIYSKRFDSGGNALGDDMMVTDDSGSRNQDFPCMAVDGAGNFVIAWEDRRNNFFPDIYCQRYDASGAPLGKNFIVNNDTYYTQEKPSIAIKSNGDFVIAWTDRRNSHPDIYCQRYDASGTPLGENFRVNNDETSKSQEECNIAMNDSGKFIITWTDLRDGYYHIYCQIYDERGNPIGENFRADYVSSHACQPVVELSPNGGFIIAWYDYKSNIWDIYCQRYDEDGDTIGASIKVNDNIATGSARYLPDITVDNMGNFVVAWEDSRNGQPDIYCQRYNADGDALGVNFIVNDANIDSSACHPSISNDDEGNFIISWKDERYGTPNIYAKFYDQDGNAYDYSFCINNTFNFNTECSNPTVILNNNMIYSAWQENKVPGRGYDIIANLINITLTKTGDIISKFLLSQNYPNPLNPTTTISYDLPQTSNVTLNIYDITGRLVQTLVNQRQSSGKYQIKWNSSSFSSGIYLYRLQADNFIQTKRMIVIK